MSIEKLVITLEYQKEYVYILAKEIGWRETTSIQVEKDEDLKEGQEPTFKDVDNETTAKDDVARFIENLVFDALEAKAVKYIDRKGREATTAQKSDFRKILNGGIIVT